MIDTHSYFNTLKEAGIEERQANALTKGIAAFLGASFATKADVQELRADINERFNGVNERFNGVNERLNGVDARLGALQEELTIGLQKNFLAVLSVVGAFLAAAAYVGLHLK